jgi:glycine betaine transporter
MMTSGGALKPPVFQKMVWGGLIALLTLATVISESVEVARAMAVIGALPFSVILLMQIVGFMREVRRERPDLTRPTEMRRRRLRTEAE